jgi:ubiquinone/menaquinone biosynthesis C-methylase UbiE
VGFYRERVLPRIIDRACGTRDLRAWREQAARGLSGTIVEVGFGSGLNLAAYPDEVELVHAVEPVGAAWRLAGPRIAGSPVAVERVGLRGESIPLPHASCDGALSTFTLCTIPDVEAALLELRRVLRPGGRLHLLEHGRSPDAGVARWQRRIEPLQKRVAGGCHLTRDPIELVRGAGFLVEQAESRYLTSPSPWTWLTVAVARTPA